MVGLASAPRVNACERLAAVIAKVGHGPVEILTMREILPVSLAALSEKADSVIEGHVVPVKTYLSEDGCYLLTDFAVTIMNSIAGTNLVSTRPGMPLVFTQFGGEDVIQGVKVTVQDRDMPLLRAGQRVILFLRQSAETKKYELAGLGGAFEVIDQQVVPIVRAPVDPMSSNREMFISSVRDFHARRKSKTSQGPASSGH
jgi:hypothetical protein